MTKKNLLVAAATLALAGTALAAHPHPEGGEKVERVIIMNSDGKAKDGETRSFRIRQGVDDTVRGMAFADCDGDKTEVKEGEGKEKTQIFLCTKGKLSGEERAKRLEELRSRLAKNDHMSVEHRAKVEAAIQDAINRARAGK